MNIQIRSANVAMSTALHEHVIHRIELALRRFAPRVRRVIVRIVDLNGPKGGLDKRCRIHAALDHGGTVIAEATSADVYVASTRAAAEGRGTH